jgi:hypothetical protein
LHLQRVAVHQHVVWHAQLLQAYQSCFGSICRSMYVYVLLLHGELGAGSTPHLAKDALCVRAAHAMQAVEREPKVRTRKERLHAAMLIT